jgi:phosphoribosylamine---glycine ligase
MNILLLGSGGREHALAWKLAQSPQLAKLWAAPGNPGVAEHARCVAFDVKNHGAVTAFCREQAIDLVVIGPEAPLVDGLADSLRSAGVAVFGPSAAAARLEGSKGFTKDLCARAGIPTAAYRRTRSHAEAVAALESFAPPFVLKADGLAAGKGVVIAETADEAWRALAEMFGGQFGPAGAEVVIEEFLSGEEVSFFALTDGHAVASFGSAQDHKRAGEGDTGPNTGGMGAYSPAAVLTAELEAQVLRDIVAPTLRALRVDGTPFCGVLFAGLMLTAEGPKLIEYNVRFGDPECQVLMMRYRGDLAALLHACATGALAAQPAPAFSRDHALCVVMAAAGYPGPARIGGALTLTGGERAGVKVFQAGTRQDGEQLVVAGGRVLAVSALGNNVTSAQAAAYEAVRAIDFADGFYRNDIGWREIAREAKRGGS